MLEVLYHRAKFGGTWISPAAGAIKNVEFVCLSACLSVRHAFERQRLCARFPHEGVGVILMPLDTGRFVVVHSCLTFSDWCQPLKSEVQKRQKLGRVVCRQRATH